MAEMKIRALISQQETITKLFAHKGGFKFWILAALLSPVCQVFLQLWL